MNSLRFIIIAVMFSFASCIQEKTQPLLDGSETSIDTSDMTSQFNSNYAHIVYFWLKNPKSLEDRKAFETSLGLFMKTSAYAQTNFIGTPPVAIRDIVDDSFTYNLVVTFESSEAQEKYQVEAVHKKFIADAGHLWDKVIVYDATSIF